MRVSLLILTSVDDDRAVARNAAADVIGRQYRMPFEQVVKWTAYGSAGTVAALLGAYRDAGVTEFVFMPAGAPLAQYDRLAALPQAGTRPGRDLARGPACRGSRRVTRRPAPQPRGVTRPDPRTPPVCWRGKRPAAG